MILAQFLILYLAESCDWVQLEHLPSEVELRKILVLREVVDVQQGRLLRLEAVPETGDSFHRAQAVDVHVTDLQLLTCSEEIVRRVQYMRLGEPWTVP